MYNCFEQCEATHVFRCDSAKKLPSPPGRFSLGGLFGSSVGLALYELDLSTLEEWSKQVVPTQPEIVRTLCAATTAALLFTENRRFLDINCGSDWTLQKKI